MCEIIGLYRCVLICVIHDHYKNCLIFWIPLLAQDRGIKNENILVSTWLPSRLRDGADNYYALDWRIIYAWNNTLTISLEYIKNNAWVTVNNDFGVTSEAIFLWFSRVTKSQVKIIGKSRVTQKSLFTVTNVLFYFLHAILCGRPFWFLSAHALRVTDAYIWAPTLLRFYQVLMRIPPSYWHQQLDTYSGLYMWGNRGRWVSC